ncbi:MAG: hypothetical protein CMG25_06280 [Candidatus Marinimicrobia bacterium]|nr:hypothetical protein [Candidatus Neomarinimicrobiota bacterium]
MTNLLLILLLLLDGLFGDTIKLVINYEDKPSKYTNLFQDKLTTQEISISGRYLGIYKNFIFIQTVDKIERYECNYVIEIKSNSGANIPFDCSQNDKSLKDIYKKNPNTGYTLLLSTFVVGFMLVTSLAGLAGMFITE